MPVIATKRVPRRGMLLLIVLLMLTLFMVTGIAMLTIATRARTVSRANLTATNKLAVTDEVLRPVLDKALMAALRGTPAASPISESLLADKYGDSSKATGIITKLPAASSTNPPMLVATLTAIAPAISHPSRLNGRIVTFKPVAGDGDVCSFRVVTALPAAADATQTLCLLRNLAPNRSLTMPTLTCPVVINGREFTPLDAAGTTGPESYDACDPKNKWLAEAGQQTSFGGAAEVDNDGDGVKDGAWLSGVLPDQGSALGGTLKFKVSYYIIDLDGRLNVNAQGPAKPPNPADYTGTPPVPLGMGYGPADVDPSPTLPAPAGATASFPPTCSDAWRNMTAGGAPKTTSTDPSANQRRAPPLIGTVHGRYGPSGKPGVKDDATKDYSVTTSGTGNTGTVTAPTTAPAPEKQLQADLKARMKVYMTPPAAGQVTATLNSYLPDWNTDPDSTDNPYQSRLDTGAPHFSAPQRPAPGAGGDDNPFTLAEMERVLRSSDADAPQLPQRLAAILEEKADQNRIAITTDSWDTPGLTGGAARKIEDYMASLPVTAATVATVATGPYAVMSPDVATGVRLDINRTVTTSTAVSTAQVFCKHLYSLQLALGETDKAKAAQWAANVLDFRDSDVKMTYFFYDSNLADGWAADGTMNLITPKPLVFGAERPEIIITETAAWRNTTTGQSQLFVTLHRPAWNAVCTQMAGKTAVPNRELLDTALGANNQLDLAKTSVAAATPAPTTPVVYPIWRLRFESTAVTFSKDVKQATATTLPADTAVTAVVTPGTTAPISIAPNGYLCVHSATPTQYTPGVPALAISNGSFAFPPGTSTGKVYLERLANPTAAWSSPLNPYVVVDTATVQIPDVGSGQPPAKQRRKGPADSAGGTGSDRLKTFWRQEWQSDSSTTLGAYAGANATKPAAWFHWPNRPFISTAELALVPTGTPDEILRNYSFPTTSPAAAAGNLILDATIVPSRFTGNTVAFKQCALATGALKDFSTYGFTKLGIFDTFSQWREPGRVNVNTIPAGSAATIWPALIGGPQPPTNPFTATSPATSIGQLLGVGAGGAVLAQDYPANDPRDLNALLAIAVPNRLANVATVRSQVLAVWVTVEATDTSANASAPVTKRLFAIVDRSLPVGYALGENLTAAQCIRLKRFID